MGGAPSRESRVSLEQLHHNELAVHAFACARDHLGPFVLPTRLQAMLACTCSAARQRFPRAADACTASHPESHAQRMAFNYSAGSLLPNPCKCYVTTSADDLRLLGDSLALDHSVSSLILHGGDLRFPGAHALSHWGLRLNTTLSSIDLGATSMDACALQAVADALRSDACSKNVKTLSLELNPLTARHDANDEIDSSGIASLANTIAELRSLEALFLHCCGLDDFSVSIIAEACISRSQNNQSRLRKLSLADNKKLCQVSGIPRAIRCGASPVELYLSSTSISENAAKALSNAILSAPESCRMQRLVLHNTVQLGSIGVRSFERLAQLEEKERPMLGFVGGQSAPSAEELAHLLSLGIVVTA
jgi:hypothetical protein